MTKERSNLFCPNSILQAARIISYIVENIEINLEQYKVHIFGNLPATETLSS